MHTWLRAFVCHLLVHVRIHVCKTCRYPGGPFFDMWRSVFSTGDAGRVLTAWEAKAKFGRRNVCFDKLVVGIVGAGSPLTIHTQATTCQASPLVTLGDGWMRVMDDARGVRPYACHG